MKPAYVLATLLTGAVPAYQAPAPAYHAAPAPRAVAAPAPRAIAPRAPRAVAPRVIPAAPAPNHSSAPAVRYESIEIPSQGPLLQLLATYGLTQTYCGLPNVVVIWGPGSAMTCAYSNSAVAPGTYQVDPATLTLTPQAAPP